MDPLKALYFASSLIASCSFAVAAALPPFAIDVTSREQVRAFYNGVYNASTNSDLGWTGSMAACNPGTNSDEARERIRLRINYYRAMAGVPAAIALDPLFNTQCQAAALMFSKNEDLSHEPPESWGCYSLDGALAAAKSNISYGQSGPDAIDGIMIDRGSGNYFVGHRRWLLYPQTLKMGTGDIPDNGSFRAASALWVLDGNFLAARPPVRDAFVSWPPPGFMPHTLMPVRWSLSFPKADFSGATILVSSNGVNIQVQREMVEDGYAENTVAWRFADLNPNNPYDWPKPASDVVYHVRIGNVQGSGIPSNFTYDITVFDPATTGAGSVNPVISGPDLITTLAGGLYSVPNDPLATGHDLRAMSLEPVTEIEGAEGSLDNFATNTSKSYSLIVSPGNSGAKGFRLTHAGGNNQFITYTRSFFAQPGAEIRFASRLSRAQTTEFAKVQISRDNGATWVDLFSQNGNGSVSTPVESSFVQRAVSLENFQNQPLLARFAYTSTGATFDVSIDNVGWYFDDITFINCAHQGEPVISPLAEEMFLFRPPATGLYALQVRSKVWGDFPLDFGPLKVVKVNGGDQLGATITPLVTLNKNNIQFTFNITASGLPLVLIYKANSLKGPWEADFSASLEVLSPNAQFRATIPTNSAPATFYRAGFLL